MPVEDDRRQELRAAGAVAAMAEKHTSAPNRLEISPAMKAFVDRVLVPAMVKEYLKEYLMEMQNGSQRADNGTDSPTPAIQPDPAPEQTL